MFFPIIFDGPEAACPLFQSATLPTSGQWVDLAYAGGYFVACGFAQATSNPTVAYSADGGVTWSNGVGASTVQNNWFNIAKSADYWLVIAIDDFGGAKKYQRSSDAVNWTGGNITGVTAADSNKWTGLIYESVLNKFVMFNDRSSGQTRFYSSAGNDGIIWATHSLLPSSKRWQSVASNGTTIVTVGINDDGTDSNNAAYSPVADCLTNFWTAATLPSTGTWGNVIWTGTCYFATTRFSTSAARSYDNGATWEAVTLPHGLNNNPVNANPDSGKLFLMLNDFVGTPDTYYTSVDDGDTWTECSIADGAWAMLATTGDNHVVITNGTSGSFSDGAVYHI